jgi:hypothetical protein
MNKFKVLILLPLMVLLLSARCTIRPLYQQYYDKVVSSSPAGTNLQLIKRSENYRNYFIVKENGQYYAMKYSAYSFFGRSDRYTPYEYFEMRRFKVRDIGNNNYRAFLRIFEETDVQIKDLEQIAAMEEKEDFENLVTDLEERYGFSEARSTKVATLVQNWEKINKSRSMTNKDQDILLGKLTGSSVEKWKKALESSDSPRGESLDDLIERASKVNDVSPEHFRDIMIDYLQD